MFWHTVLPHDKKFHGCLNFHIKLLHYYYFFLSAFSEQNKKLRTRVTGNRLRRARWRKASRNASLCHPLPEHQLSTCLPGFGVLQLQLSVSRHTTCTYMQACVHTHKHTHWQVGCKQCMNSEERGEGNLLTLSAQYLKLKKKKKFSRMAGSLGMIWCLITVSNIYWVINFACIWT